MRVLTVCQPWAWAIVHGGKDVENRTRNVAGSYRGPVAIHAALADADNAPDSLWLEAQRHPSAVLREPGRSHAVWQSRGVIIGVVDLVDVHSASVIGGCGWMDNDCPEHGACRHHCSTWAMGPTEGGWFQHLVLENSFAFTEPIPAKGKLGLWKPDVDLAGEIQTAMRPGREGL